MNAIFVFLQKGQALTAQQSAIGAIGVPVSDPGTSPAGSQWEIGSPAAIQDSSGNWVQNWVQVAIPVAYAQSNALSQVGQTLANKIAAGFVYNGSTIAIDAGSRSDLNGMESVASKTISPPAGVTMPAWPSNFAWPTMSGAPLPISTPTEFVQMAATVAHYVTAIMQYAQSLSVQIESATTSADVASILSSESWPTS